MRGRGLFTSWLKDDSFIASVVPVFRGLGNTLSPPRASGAAYLTPSSSLDGFSHSPLERCLEIRSLSILATGKRQHQASEAMAVRSAAALPSLTTYTSSRPIHDRVG